MNRNITIVMVILVLVVIAGYLVWLRSKFQSPVTPAVEEQVQVSITPEPELSASPSAPPGSKEATGSVKEKSGTAPASAR